MCRTPGTRWTPTGPWASRANDPSRRRSRVLAAEHYLACPDVFHEDPDLDWSTYHEELMRLREWRFRWN
ncbi:DUF4253 domain-containing protein [Streptomyces globisporus]|uniref:DUF4253 domain-containing protein n=1 Tax=Streptomyces globisporus TaxID=1908 RepID=UPI0036F6F699